MRRAADVGAMAPAVTATVAGSCKEPGFADGPAGVARFNLCVGVAAAPDGSCFVADRGNHRVRRVAPDGAVTTVAGTGVNGHADGAGEVAMFALPYAIVMDRDGSLYVTEPVHGRVRRVARVGGGGWEVSTVVAGGLHHPRGVVVDPAGHLMVADHGNHRVLRITLPGGEMTRLAGDGTHGFRDGPAATARFCHPMDVAVDRRGNVFVADGGNHRVRRIAAADGTVSTVAGTGELGYVDGPGIAARLTRPLGVAVDGTGALVVVSPNRVRRIAATADHTVTTMVVRWEAGLMLGAIDRDGALLVAAGNGIVRVTGLGLVPPHRPRWSLRAHRGLARADPAVAAFVATVMLCAGRLDREHADAGGAVPAPAPRLPFEMWAAVLSMVPPSEMRPPR